MRPSELQPQLEQLQKILASHPELDSDSVVVLQKIAADLKTMGIEADPSLSDVVQEQALNFEQDYPTLAEVLRRIVTTLGNMGV